MSRIILVTGSNSGIGYELVRVLASKPEKHTVYLAARNEKSGREAQAKLHSDHKLDNVKFVLLDITDLSSVQKAKATIEKEEDGKLDVLVHNAGAGYLDQNQAASTVDLALVRSAMETNLFGMIQTTQAFLPLLRNAAKAGNRPRPVVLLNTTDMASNGYQARPEAFLHCAAYNTSKAAANSYIIALSHEVRSEGILVNCVTPGFTSTKLNNYGEGGGSTAQAGELLAKWALLEGELEGKTGLFWSYKGEFPW
ncbi:NAD(P)-binding protein [Marasmius fiardii PR-910]|nr:NAD(P)-binding protein [Marasmius fiardii PR-910]